jgi:spermine oxidase
VSLVTGENARLMERCTDDEVSAGAAALLAAFPAIPVDAAAAARPSVLRSRWGSDPLFRGSYSYVNASGCPDDIDALAAPLTVSSLERTPLHQRPTAALLSALRAIRSCVSA